MRSDHARLHKRLIVVALMITISSFFVSPKIARAQFADTIGGPIIARNAIKFEFSQAILAAATQGLVQATSMFLRQFAYDLAVGLASGAKGQNPLAFLSEPGAYFNALAQDATGELIGTLSEGTWDQMGLDLCKPQIPQVALKIQLGLAQGVGAVDRPKPKCQWQQIANNWNSVVNQVRDPNYLLQNVALQFKPGQSDIGAAIALEGALANKLQANQQAGLAKRLEGNGILPKEGLISGNIETPAAVTKKKFEDLVDDSDNEFLGDNYDILNATVGGETWLALGKTVMSTFTNTLSQKLLQNVVGGLFQLARGSGGGTNINLNNLYAVNPQGIDGIQAAQQAYSSLLVSNIKTGTGVDLVTEFSTCPQKREEGGIYNCVVDPQFAAALQQANAGTPLTVREAVAKRYLDANKPFGFSDPRASKEPDVTEGYSYSNMKKLRLARVIPVGWEFAAMKTKDDGVGRKNLGEVIDGFAKVGSVAGCGQPRSEDPTESPFCGLVDPDWVLKVPPAQCAQSAPGKLIDSSGSRMDSCIDLQNCVAEDERGNCKAWGYCTKEKRSWSVGGDTCPAEYATCQGFQNTRTNQQVSYLRNTLDSTTCNSENAGCRWYSTTRNIDDTNWKADSRIYLNGKAQTCNATAAGCTEFISSSANLIQNPGFEKNTTTGTTITTVDGWKPGLFTGYLIGAGNAYEGNAAMRGDSGFGQVVALESAAEYTLSIYGKGTGAVVVRVSGDVEQTRTTCTSNGGSLSLVFRPLAAGNATSFARGTCTFYTTNATLPQVTVALKDGDATTVVDAIQLEKGARASSFHAGYGASQSAFLKAPPAWLGCTGEEGESSECRNYARVCRREEVGCEEYKPVTADAALTGTITSADRCPQECVGYAAYKQEPSAFEGALYPQYIIPSRANACPGEDIGCSAFTNLQSEKVEYYREVRACELPPAVGPADDSDSYVTWEGSENSGYQIKNWVLKKSGVSIAGDNNAPANKGTCGTNNRCSNASTVSCRTNDDCIVNAFGQGQSGTPAVPPCTNYELVETGGTLRMECRDTPTNQATCVAGQVGVDPDCRGFYDAAGNIFYRQYSRTVLVTSSCSFARIGGTGQQLDEGACMTRGGDWRPSTRTCKIASGHVNLETNLVDVVSCAYGRGTWRADRQECVYAIFAPESRSCQAASLGCREYSGNAGNNVRTIFTENFDAGIGNWQPGSPKMVQSSEAVNPGGYAARVEASMGSPTRITRSDIALDQNATYVVEFWAKGTGTVVPQLVSGSTIIEMTSRGGALTTNWQRYSFGPTTVSFASSASGTLAFALSGSNARMYIDIISLKKVAQSLPLIQASTKNIPQSCDSTPAALGGARAPQYMLGCAEYKDRANVSQYIKSFSRFCRASSVGCTELANTHNSSEQFGSNVWNKPNAGVCRGLPNTDCYYNALTDTYQNTPGDPGDGFTLLCRIGAGQTSCTYGQTTTGAPNLTADDVVVPAHSRSYLVVNTAGSCKQEEKGCQALGQQTATGWNTVYYKNLPDTYGETMCRHEENGCDAWTGGAGAVYFKAPTTTNECVWKDSVQIAGAQYNGWFKPNTVVVSSINTPAECARAQGQWNQAASQCLKGDMPCYGEITWNGTTWNINTDPEKTFLIGGKTFGVWKNIDSLYRGNIASCPQAQIGCTELVDRNDCRDAERKNCTAYYVIDNDKLDKQTCREKNSVSAKDGCVLFDDTSDPDKLYNTASSYQSGHLTAAVSVTDKNNANVLLSVRLDRSCAEWLTCQSAASVFDSSLGRFKLVCNTLGRCNEIVSRPDQGEVGQCANWVDQDTGDTTPVGRARAANLNARLTRDIYQKRDITSFTAMDFSGYSIPNFYPIDRLAQVSWKNPVVSNAPDFRLAVVVPCNPTTDYKCEPYRESSGVSNVSAWAQLGRCTEADPARDNTCGPKDAAGKGTGLCYENKLNAAIKTCIQNPDGAPATVPTAVSIACRAYPDRGAPFPSNPTIKSAQAFANATFCDDATGAGCECDYRKASYGGIKDFYFAKGATLEPKVCIGGTANLIPGVSENTGDKKEGQSCIANSECISGDCRALNKVTDYKGSRGYCLEYDTSRSVYGDENQHPCLTWLPSDSAVGSSDIYNQYTAAGFQPNPGNEWYCSAPTTDANSRTIEITPTKTQPNGSIDYEYSTKFFGRPRIIGNGNACSVNAECTNRCAGWFDGAGGWCNWPDASAIDRSSPPDPLGPVPVIKVGPYKGAKMNYLGCYNVSDNGTIDGHIIENDWIGPGPIYRNMIEAIEVQLENTEGHCAGYGVVGQTGHPDKMVCNFENGRSGSLGPDSSCKDNASFVMRAVAGGNEFGASPVFDTGTGKLTGFRYQQFDGGYDGSVFISKVKIILKPGCQEIQKISEKGAYTDRLWDKGQKSEWSEANRWYRVTDDPGLRESPPRQTKDAKLNPLVRYQPWGAVGPNPVRSSYIVDAATDPSVNPPTPDYCKSPGSQWCGAAYDVAQLKQLFAFTTARAAWSTASTNISSAMCLLERDQLTSVFPQQPKALCYKGVSGLTYNETGDVSEGQAKAPTIKPVVNCRDDGKCFEGSGAGVTVGDKSGAQDLVLGYGGLLQTTMRFYAWADKDHMPLKRIVVDWHGADDGGLPEYDAGSQNYYRNRRGLDSSGKEQCVDEKTAGEYANRDKYGFGSIINKSCDNAYFKFQITYTCSGKTSPFWEDASSCPLSEFASRYGGCCVFQPRAKVVDNWDWCSGNGGQTTGSCNELKGWVNFAGKVLVAPKYRQ